MIDDPIKPDPRRTTEKASDRAHDTVDSLADRAAPAEERLREGAERSGGQARDVGEDMRRSSEDFMETINGYIRDNPMTAVCLAFAAGTILTALRNRD